MSKKAKICISLISLLIGVLFFVIIKNDIMVVLNSGKDIYEEPVDRIEQLKVGTAIETDIPFTYGCIISGEAWTEREDGTKYGSSREVYYLVPVFDKKDNMYMALMRAELDSSLHKQLKKLENDCLAYTGEGTISAVEFNGGVYPINEELLKFAKEVVAESGMITEQSELDKYILPICLSENDAVNGYVGSAVCGVCLLIAVVFFAWSFAKGPKNENGVSYATRLKELKALDPSIVVKINGYNLSVSAMQDVDKAIFEGDMEKAVKKLKGYRASQEEAERIAADWKKIAHMQ